MHNGIICILRKGFSLLRRNVCISTKIKKIGQVLHLPLNQFVFGYRNISFSILHIRCDDYGDAHYSNSAKLHALTTLSGDMASPFAENDTFVVMICMML